MRYEWALSAVAGALAIAATGCGASEKPADKGPLAAGSACVAGRAIECKCTDGQTKMTTCISDRRAADCPCFGNADGTVMQYMKPEVPMPAGTGGMSTMSGTGGGDPGGGTAGVEMMSGTGGAPVMSGTGGAPVMSGTGGGGGGMPTGTAEIEALRQVCVDTINMYRATVAVTPMLSPLLRGTPDEETCSDEGAKEDGDAMRAHGSAGSCQGYNGQDTCPGWPVGGFGGATLEASLKKCLQQMWDEGEPPNGREECQKDQAPGGCFQTYGHYLNMSNPGYTGVICGFYQMQNGNWWMNQDFKSKPWGAP